MKVLIIEDEVRAANRLEKLLLEIDFGMEIIGKTESIKETLHYFSTGTKPDLILSDIQLEDGLSFEIFEQIDVPCPIIFTTAYDQYAINAFQTNGIDYLLKPVEKERLEQSLQKAKKLTQTVTLDTILALAKGAVQNNHNYKNRFVIKIGERIKTILAVDVVAFYSMNNATYLFTIDGKKYLIDYRLEQIETLVDPEQFFRISRKYIISVNGCNDIIAWSNSRLKIQISGMENHLMIVARERVQSFKEWLDK